jgi:Xaa-Pro aminopeptidase
MIQLGPGPTFSDAEFQRRWQAVADELETYAIDAMAATSAINVNYLNGYDDDGMWPSPVIIGPDAKPTFVSREYDELTARELSRVPDIRTFFGDHDNVQVWADTLRSLGLDKARLGVDLETYGCTPTDIARLQQLLPDLKIVDATNLMRRLTAFKSDEELAVMRHAMELTKIGLETFYASLHEGADEWAVKRRMEDAMIAAGSEPYDFELLFGDRTRLPHGGFGGSNALKQGDIAFTELTSSYQGYCAALSRTALLGRDPDVEAVHKLAEEAQQATWDAIRPGVTTGEVDRAYRETVHRSPLGIVSHSRCGYAIGFNWHWRGSISIHPYGEDILEEGMTIHMPAFLFRPGKFGVGVSDTVLITKNGPEIISGLGNELVFV